MRPLYFVPDADSRLLADCSRDDSLYFNGGRSLPEDIHWRVLCNRLCLRLAQGESWENALDSLGLNHPLSLAARAERIFLAYMGMTPRCYVLWCEKRDDSGQEQDPAPSIGV